MSDAPLTPEIVSVLARFDRTSPETLLMSLAAEIARLSRAQADLAARLKAVEQMHSIEDRLLAVATARQLAALPASAVVDAMQTMLDATGFYGLEFDGSGKPYRWTGPGTDFSVEFFLNRQHGGVFTLHFSRFAGPAAPGDVRCLVDGVPAGVEAVELGGASFEISGPLPVRLDAGPTLLTFVLPATASPRELGISSDERQLGLAFQSVTAHANQPDPDAGAPAAARKPKRPQG